MTVVRWTTCQTHWTTEVRAGNKQNCNMASAVTLLHEWEKNKKNWGKYIEPTIQENDIYLEW